MRARATARLLIVAIAAALAVGSAAQPRLVPPEEPNGAIPAAYQRDVSQVFAEAHGADVLLRAIVLPGLGAEFAVGLRRRGAGHEIAEAMRDHCGNGREETLREIVALARQLGRP